MTYTETNMTKATTETMTENTYENMTEEERREYILAEYAEELALLD